MERKIRNAAKALIIQDDKMLAIKISDGKEEWYIMPGGGQDAEELLPDTVSREVEEELGLQVEVKDLVFVIEGLHGENFHRVDLVFLCKYIEKIEKIVKDKTEQPLKDAVIIKDKLERYAKIDEINEATIAYFDELWKDENTRNVLMNVSVGVKYDIYFDAASMTVYVMPDGQKPAALAAMQRMMSTRAGENKSNFADFKRGRMNNIETHDEERIGYKAITWGQEYVKGDWAVISKRMQAVYAFHFLTPYPKMMWQFGELGYDFSINANDSGVVGTGDEYRTHRKPIRWDYYEDVNRRALYDAMSKFVAWRTDHEDYYGQDNLPVHTWNVGDVNMSGKVLVMDKVIVVANFTNAEATTTVTVPSAGQWTNLMTGGSMMLGSTHDFTLAGSDYIILVRE